MALIPSRMSQILVEEHTDQQIVFISERDGGRRFQLMIGPMEAMAIERAVTGQRFPRPLTHDLLNVVIHACGHRIVEVRIVDLREGTFYAVVVLAPRSEGSSKRIEIDARPSDALALASANREIPVLVEEDVFAKAQ